MAGQKVFEISGPVDRLNIVYVIFGWLGIGTLLPWNFFITVNSYWDYKYRSVNDTYDAYLSNDASTGLNDIQTTWKSKMSVASMVPNVTMLLLNAAFGHHFKTTPRLLISLILVIVLFGFTSAMAVIDTDDWQATFMLITIISVVFINVNSAIFQGGLLGLVGSFPPQYMGVVFSGQAIGGIFASATNVLVIAMGADPVYSAFFCFLIAVVFLASALVFFVIVTRSEFYQYYLGEQVPTKEQITESGDKAELSGKFLQDNTEVIILPVKVNPLLVLGKISLYAASVFSIFVVTLACFPAVTVLVVSTGLAEGGQWSTVYFIPVACFLLFNVGDLIGRFSAQYLQWPKPGRLGMIIVFTLSMARLAFIPLFLVCNAKPGGRHVTDVYFYSDLAYIIVMSLFSVTNGYLANICMMSAPQVCKGPEAQTAASIMVALLGLGLGTGALMSYPVQMLL